ncbi:alpha-ketoglutarate-dependent dioxygenase alkB homolog 7, mitochondrial-like [Lineus longissimus]|uniref:alpha-ketoglutarate-dependent dioxygenase alkB homolog 7, mitochondrial-like n=1 Tax=Lineus longissimus TaxID=88925 RepID=UPI002B4E4C2D
MSIIHRLVHLNSIKRFSVHQVLSILISPFYSSNILRQPFSTLLHATSGKPGSEVNCHFGVKNIHTNLANLVPSLSCMDASDDSTFSTLSSDMLIYENFIDEEEERDLFNEIEPYVKKLRYEYDHWDNAIHGYRETERRNWTKKNKRIIQRIRDLAFPPEVAQLAYVHILDLHEDGHIKPHVDSVKFCGDTIAGVSLLSSSVMGLVHEKDETKWAKFLLGRRSLYIMKGTARYDYKHEVYGGDKSVFKNRPIPRDRRISVICRNEVAKYS